MKVWPQVSFDPKSPCEPEKAVGVIEFLEPNKVWILVPSGEDKNYDKRVLDANRDLWDMFSSKQFISYEVSNPYEYFMILEGLVHWQINNETLYMLASESISKKLSICYIS